MNGTKKIALSVPILLIAALAAPGTAFATWTTSGTGNDNDIVWVGMVDVAGDGNSFRVAAVCYDSQTNNANDIFYIIGNSSGLTSNGVAYGDSSISSSGNDTMRMVTSNGTNPSGFCGTSGGAVGTWNVLSYAGFYADLSAEGGTDTVIDGGGSTDTEIWGGQGQDYLQASSSIGRARGEEDADTIYGMSSGSGDRLEGGTGNDCLWDSTNTFTTFDCGGDSGDVRDNRNTGTTGCPNADPCCGIC